MSNERFSRQSFFGKSIARPRSSGLSSGSWAWGAGAATFVQQLAHVGFLNYRLFDRDGADETNLNRLVIATEGDAAAATLKVELANRRILSNRRAAKVETFPCRWQEQPEPLHGCDIIFGCVDGFAEWRELEVVCRRYLVPLLDIGMDVHIAADEPPRGWPDHSVDARVAVHDLPWLLNEASLAREAGQYGDAGIRPQVVWPNGVLASTVVGIAVDLLTNWTRSLRGPVDGNIGTITPRPAWSTTTARPARTSRPRRWGRRSSRGCNKRTYYL